jgi:hypothetical protein
VSGLCVPSPRSARLVLYVSEFANFTERELTDAVVALAHAFGT